MGALQLTPEIVQLERQRSELANRLRWLSPNSRRSQELRGRQVAVTHRLLALENALIARAENALIPAEPELDLADEGAELKWFQK